MNAFQHIDAISNSFFGLLAIWGAVDRRHWFLRFAVVGAMLLAVLLIPAYDLVILFGVQIVLMLLILGAVRSRQHLQHRLSLSDALLLMVVVAVVMAVGVRVPDFKASRWTEVSFGAVSSAYLGLVCMWIVFGESRLRFRITLGLFGIAASLPLIHLGLALTRGMEWWELGKDGWPTFLRFYHPDYLRTWPPTQFARLAYGCALFITALALARASGWFFNAQAAPPLGRRWLEVAARVGLSGVLLFIAAPLLYLLFRLLTPEPLPDVTLPAPNGYDDFVAAGQAAPPNLKSLARRLNSPTIDSLMVERIEDSLKRFQQVYDRIDLGLQREAAMDWRELTRPKQFIYDLRPVLRTAEDALWVRYAVKSRTGTAREQTDCLFQIMGFVNKAYRGTGITWLDYSGSGDTTELVVYTLGEMLPKLDAAECREVALRLYQLDRNREPWSERVRVERLIDIHEGWRSHLRILLSDLGGWDAYDWHQANRLRRLEEHRSVAIAYAVRAYCLERGRPPLHADALIPEYLPTILEDPYDGKPMKLKASATSIAVYSVGTNGVDDDGVPHPVDDQGRIYTDQMDSARILPLNELGLDSPASPP